VRILVVNAASEHRQVCASFRVKMKHEAMENVSNKLRTGRRRGTVWFRNATPPGTEKALNTIKAGIQPAQYAGGCGSIIKSQLCSEQRFAPLGARC
jgi:hypothetical protein